jgi:hypothetical protein
MKIEDLSFVAEVTEEDTTKVNGGYIDYWDIAIPTSDAFYSMGDFMNAVGLDGSYLNAAGDAYYGEGPLAVW